MTRKTSDAWRIVGPDIDLKKEVILDSKGRRIDDAYVDQALAVLEEARRSSLADRAGEALAARVVPRDARVEGEG